MLNPWALREIILPNVEIEQVERCPLVEVENSRSPKKVFLGLTDHMIEPVQQIVLWDWASLRKLGGSMPIILGSSDSCNDPLPQIAAQVQD